MHIYIYTAVERGEKCISGEKELNGLAVGECKVAYADIFLQRSGLCLYIKNVQRLAVSRLTALALYICEERLNSVMAPLGKT